MIAFARGEHGALELRVAGAWVAALPSGGLWIAAERTLVCADLHLEKGSAYAARGQLLPPYDTRDTLAKLAADARRMAPARIVLLGDALHDLGAEGRMAPADREALGALARGRTLVWAAGNHDPEGATGALPGETAGALTVQGLILRHEPLPGLQPGEAAGHLHPCARVTGRGASVRRRCFVTDGQRLILPAYGAYAGGLSIRDPAFAGLFAQAPLAAAIGRGRVHAVGFDRVRGE